MTIGRYILDDITRRIGVVGAAARTGLSSSAVSRHLSGDRVPNRTARWRYAQHLGISEAAWDTTW